MTILAPSVVSSSNSRVYNQTPIDVKNNYSNYNVQILRYKEQLPYSKASQFSNLDQSIGYKDFIELYGSSTINRTNKCLGFQQINILPHNVLKKPINIIVEHDEGNYISHAIDLPLYANGNDAFEAIQNLKIEIETLYNELMEDDQFSDEWLNYKKFLKSIID